MSFDLEITDSDLSIRPDGAIKTVTDTPKLRQDVLKAIITPLGTNKFHPWYGCTISDDNIGEPFSEDLRFARIEESILATLDRLRLLQQSQLTFQNVSLSELISEVGPVIAERNFADPRQINVIVTVYTQRLTKIEEIFTVIA